MSVSDLAKLSGEELGRLTTILVSCCLYEDVLELAGIERSRVFPVRMPTVTQTSRELDVQSLEEIRVAAGVLV